MKKSIIALSSVLLLAVTSCGSSKPTAEQQTALLAGIGEEGVFGIASEELITAMYSGEIVSGQEFEFSSDCIEGAIITSGTVTFTIEGSKLKDVEFKIVFDMNNCKVDIRDTNPDATICGKAPIITIDGELQLSGTTEELVMTGYFIEAIFDNKTFSCAGQVTMDIDAEDASNTGEICGTDITVLETYLEELAEPVAEQEFCEA